MDFWEYKDYPGELVKKITDWLEKPPHSFKFTDSFDTNLTNLAKLWGVTLHHELTNGQMKAKRCLLFEEIERQKKAIIQEALEREEKLKEESLKKLPAAAKKKVVTTSTKKLKEKPKDEERISAIEFKFTKVDILSIATLMAAANEKSMPDMIKFWNCFLTEGFIEAIDKMLQRESKAILSDNVINKFFFYLNPLQDSSVWTRLTEPDRKLQMLTLNECGLSVEAAKTILNNIGPSHHSLVYIDLYGNSLGDEIMPSVTSMLNRYDLIEFIGLGKNSLNSTENVKLLLDCVGKRVITPEEYAKYQDRVKERNLIIEKNKKLRTLKKPEDFVFHIDTLSYNEETKSRV